MHEVTSKELQRSVAAILDDLESGRRDRVVVTRNGKPVAEMKKATAPVSYISVEEFLSMPACGIDAKQFFSDIDEGIDQGLDDP